jgi:O-antigen/teichoic acid export membrane protein
VAAGTTSDGDRPDGAGAATETADAPRKAVDVATRERALRDVVVQIGSRLLNLALGVVVTALVVRTLGDAGYGEWSTLLVTVQIATYFMEFGLSSVAVREAAARPEEEGDWVGALVAVQLLLSIPVVLAGVAIVVGLSGGETEMLVAGFLLLLGIPLSVGSSLDVVYSLRMANWVPMVVLTINSVVWGAAVAVIHFTGGGLVELAIAMTATTLLTATIQTIAALRVAPFDVRPSRRAMKRLLSVGVPVGISGMLIVLYGRIDQILVFQIAGHDDAGYYGAVYQTLERAQVIPISVMATLAPVIASAWPLRRERMLTVVRLCVEFMSIGSLGALAFAIVAAEPVVTLLFGQEFAPAAPALPVLGGAFVFICFGYLTGNLMLVVGLTRQMMIVGLVALVANVGANLVVIPAHGFLGAAWVTFATEVVVVTIGFAFISTRVPLRQLPLQRLGRVALAALLLGLGLAGLSELGVPLGGLAAAALVAYPALVLALRGVEVDELRSLKALRGGA